MLAGLSGIAPFATDMYVPALPQIAADLGTDTSGAEISLTCFLAGMVVGQLFLGPLSDQVGRRAVLIAGTAAFAVGSLACAVAPSAVVLDGARLVQGFAGAAGVVVSRAVVADLHSGTSLATMFARLGAITAAAPIVAPFAGGVLLGAFTWRTVFVVLAVAGVLLCLTTCLGVPETLPAGARARAGVRAGVVSVVSVARRFDVISAVLIVGFGGATVFAYIASSSFVFHTVYGMSAVHVSVVYGVNAVGNMAGSMLFGRLVRRRSPEAVVVTGTTGGLACSAALLITGALGVDSVVTTWLLLFGVLVSVGITFPGALTISQQRGADAPGSTSALVGAVQFSFGAASAPVVGVLGATSVTPIAAVIATTSALGVVTAVIVMRARDRGPAATSGSAPTRAPASG
ncbi:multidrug effflux MFS transporter, partial [Tsukamurella paurometabola]|nr:multidrug effflux MFS transporter [Tsukamurella paurometabola]